MKSFRIILIVLFSGIIFNLSAQKFVGGSIGFHSAGDKHVNTDQKQTSYNLNLHPVAGKFISDKLSAGLALGIAMSGNKNEGNTDVKSRSLSLGVSPFLRYYAYRWNKLTVFGQGSLGAEFSKSSVKTGANTNDGPKTTIIDFSIHPGLAYDISEKFSLETSVNVLSFGYGYSITKDGGDKETGSNFNIGAGLGNILSLNAVTIGAIYKF